jgi:hypothetical protein
VVVADLERPLTQICRKSEIEWRLEMRGLTRIFLQMTSQWGSCSVANRLTFTRAGMGCVIAATLSLACIAAADPVRAIDSFSLQAAVAGLKP